MEAALSVRGGLGAPGKNGVLCEVELRLRDRDGLDAGNDGEACGDECRWNWSRRGLRGQERAA